MKRRSFSYIAFSALLAACGGGLKPNPPPAEVELDPYRPVMANRINTVLYSRRSKEQMLLDLAALGVMVGMKFADFKEESKIDDWFGEESEFLPTRYTSLTCGLSPVVDPDGKIIGLYRNRKLIDGKMHEEMALRPEG
ncbi:hypothetical protein OKA05_21370 [Luteolibacter arcticus]|uniref:DUF3192 domain-containing protein n=1 Tax=Luteolibacter arcticus TaxID=1581411 RepID=A0ABT3GNN1_9BACT|nr:hypothetical protein [Luteolibacter arcticus]MCW1925125.1 hypothetical protein [Luteolibacter arcticus]